MKKTPAQRISDKRKRERGDALLNLIIAMTITAILGAAGYYIFGPAIESSKGTSCTTNLQGILVATSAVSSDKQWASSADVDDAAIVSYLGGKAPNMVGNRCPGGGTYTWGAALSWDTDAGALKKPTCSKGPPSDSKNSTFPSAKHNIRATADE